MSKAFDNLYWHDGNLCKISFGIDKKGKSSVQIEAMFYKDEQAQARDLYQINAEGVSRLSSTLDTIELKNNMFAGNIMHGYLKNNVLWVYFTDGALEVHAQKYRIKKC